MQAKRTHAAGEPAAALSVFVSVARCMHSSDARVLLATEQVYVWCTKVTCAAVVGVHVYWLMLMVPFIICSLNR